MLDVAVVDVPTAKLARNSFVGRKPKAYLLLFSHCSISHDLSRLAARSKLTVQFMRFSPGAIHAVGVQLGLSTDHLSAAAQALIFNGSHTFVPTHARLFDSSGCASVAALASALADFGHGKRWPIAHVSTAAHRHTEL